jgi:adenosylcobinamide hydrolase
MRYYLRNGSLILRGSFRAASTGVSGGLSHVSSIISHTVPADWDHRDPERVLDGVIAREGLPHDYFGLLTAVEMKNLCVLQFDFVTVFITAGVSPGENQGGTINLIICSREGMSDAALLETIITATEAKIAALSATGCACSGTPTDAVVVACEGEVQHRYAGVLTEAGKRVQAAVRFGVPEALKRHDGVVSRDRPSFFIYSRYQGDHWVEWLPEECRYYPCHFPGQRCDFCYCPFYPCCDESLGQWVESASQNGMIWNCSQCTLLHEPEVADYLRSHPEAPLGELKAVKKRK